MAAREESARRVFEDSRGTLRDVQSVLAELSDPPGDAGTPDIGRPDPVGQGAASIGELVRTLHRVYGEIMGIVGSLRESRSVLERAAVERLQRTHAKLREVTSATEVAATGMLDGLDRALELVDRLEAADASIEASDASGNDAATEGAGPLRDQLREELHAMVSLLQFQDITAQQLGHATGVLEDIEERLLAVARVFDFDLGEDGGPELSTDGAVSNRIQETCDPEASTLGADSRQAVADEIFTSPGQARTGS